MNKSEFELIMCIVNAGFADAVMDAAHECGARGGTIIQARGTANKEAEQFFGITIQPEKEMLMLVVPAKIKDDILHALYKAVGLNSPGHGIAFSIPVSNVIGLTKDGAAGVPVETKKDAPEGEGGKPPEANESRGEVESTDKSENKAD